MLDSVRRYAIRAHGEQRYGEKPYVVHLDSVVAVLREFGYHDTALLAAGFLHDAIEDTLETYDSIRTEFGPIIAQIVQAVTDPPGKNRRERHARLYPILAKNPIAITLKLADRIANVRASIESSPSLLSMYRRENAEFSGYLRVPLREAHTPMWAELDRLQMYACLQ